LDDAVASLLVSKQSNTALATENARLEEQVQDLSAASEAPARELHIAAEAGLSGNEWEARIQNALESLSALSNPSSPRAVPFRKLPFVVIENNTPVKQQQDSVQPSTPRMLPFVVIENNTPPHSQQEPSQATTPRMLPCIMVDNFTPTQIAPVSGTTVSFIEGASTRARALLLKLRFCSQCR